MIAHKFEPDDDDEQEHCVVCGLLRDVGPGYVAHGFGVYGYGDEIVQIDPLVPPPVDLDAVKRSGARVPMTADQIETGVRAAATAGLMLPHAYVGNVVWNDPATPPPCEWCGSPRDADVHVKPAWDGQFRYEKLGSSDDGSRTAAQWDGLARYSDPAAAAFVQLLTTEDREAHERLHVALRFIGSQTNVASSQIIAVLEAAHRFFAGLERKANPLRVVAGIDVAKNLDDSVITLHQERKENPSKLVSIQQRPSGHGVHVAQCKGFVPTTGFGNQKTCASCGSVQAAHQVRAQ